MKTNKSLIIDVYYKPDTLDCYTVFIQDGVYLDVFALSEGGIAFNQHLDGCNLTDKSKDFKYKRGKHLGEKIPFYKLSDETKRAILKRI